MAVRELRLSVIIGGQRYTVEAESFARGSYGSVHKAVRPDEPGSVFAVKIVQRAHVTTDSYRRHVRRENAACSCVPLHPNIVASYGSYEIYNGWENDAYYLAMEYAQGETLLDYANRRRRVPEDEVRPIFRQAVAALHHVHRAGFAHRDVTLPNFVLAPGGHLKLLDFGLSERLCPTGAHFTDFPGTALYASPQICAGIAYNGRGADLWALGVVLFCLVANRFPFHGECVSTLSRCILDTPPNFAGLGDISAQLRSLLGGMLEKHPSRRITLSQVEQHDWLRTAVPTAPVDCPVYLPAATAVSAQDLGSATSARGSSSSTMEQAEQQAAQIQRCSTDILRA